MRRALPVVSGVVLILAGLVLIARSDAFAPVAPTFEPTPLPTAVLTLSPTPTAALGSPSPAPSPTPTRDPRAPIPDGYRVQIPRLGIDLPISEGDLVRDVDQQRTPENFAFHYPGTSIPGRGSNTYLYAHARVGMFLSLWNARPGDEIYVSTPDLRALRYVVTEVHPRVAVTETSWVLPTTDERLTLQTSTGPNPGDPRFVVVAVPMT
ncbi:MAG TPA: sortase [Candidatus Limnocylindria bacterium]